MIINFSIQNFRSIKEKVVLSFESTHSDDLDDYYLIRTHIKGLKLLKLGLIYGANASGKTTIIQALNFLRDIVVEPFEKKTDSFNYKPFLFDEKTPFENTLFTIDFIQNEVRYFYEVELNEKFIVKEKLYFYDPKKALVFSRITDSEKQLAIIEEVGSKIILSKEHKNALEVNTLWNNTVLGGFLKTNIESFELQESTDWFRKILRPIIAPKTDLLAYVTSKIENQEINKRNVVSILRKADFDISDININTKSEEITPELFEFLFKRIPVTEDKFIKIKESRKVETKEIMFLHELKNNKEFSLPYNVESAGTQRYYQFGGLLDLMIRSEIIFPIDEFESSLHPDLLKYFLLTFLVNSKKSQLIATTHHRELLMERDIFRNDSIWFTDLRDNGSTELYSLSDFDSSVVRNTSSIYNAYKIGKLGARPNLSDYYIDLQDDKN